MNMSVNDSGKVGGLVSLCCLLLDLMENGN